MEAIVLAGGRGTRLAGVVKDVPKPMADIGGTPFLAWLLRYVAQFDVARVLLATGYRHEQIEDYFGSQFAGMAIDYCREEEPLGTGGALRQALRQVAGDHALVLNGDTFFQVDLRALATAHVANGCAITMALKPMRGFDRYGAVTTRGGRVVGFEEKAFKESGYINAGVYCVNADIFNNLTTTESFSFENDFLKIKLSEVKICGYCSDTYFIDIGVPDDYRRAVSELPKITEIYSSFK
jgi:D-glycero-alpha-D-manno-heptose 1-phosphate guanylyltransferase